jgi:TolB-like protein/class 3 adenylate cyclase/Tfp pilus assembly protein PilF
MARRLAAILAADVVGYSRLMAADEAGTHARLKALQTDLIGPLVAGLHGRIVKLMGDGALAEFGSVVEAVQCAVEVQRSVAERQRELPEDQRIALRIGINLGDVIIEGDDIHGDGVNVAARLEALAEPGGVLISRTVRDHVQDKLPYRFVDLGERRVKNIPRPVHVFRVVPDGAAAVGWRRTRLVDSRGSWAAAAVVLLVAAGGAGLWLRSKDSAPPAPDQAVATSSEQTVTPVATSTSPAVAPQTPLDKHRLAVLPFANISADPEDEYFSDGMTEELISKLSRLRDLKVIARTSVMQYKQTGKSIADIGRELRVGTILEGSVRKAGERLRITAQLVDVESQGHLWSQDYDRTLDDVFAIQSAVAESVADALELTLGPGEKRQIEEHGTENLEAYQLYLQGLSLFHKFSKEALHSSIASFERALQQDPAFAEAYAGIAGAYQQLGNSSLLTPRDAFEKARAAAEKALELDDTIVEAHLAAATMSQYLDYDQARARPAYEQAVELAPNSALAHELYGIMYLSPMGRHQEAIAQLRRAVELDPVSVLYLTDLGWVYYMARQYDSAIKYLERSIELEPDAVDGHRGLGEVYVQKGMHDEAIAEMEKYVELTDSYDTALGYLGYAYGMAGQRDKALEILDRLQDRAKEQYVLPYAFAPLYVGLGDKDKAIEALWRDYDERAGSHELLWLKVFPVFDPLHSDPRFIELLRRIGVEPE